LPTLKRPAAQPDTATLYNIFDFWVVCSLFFFITPFNARRLGVCI
jgi:hypothetical protein